MGQVTWTLSYYFHLKNFFWTKSDANCLKFPLFTQSFPWLSLMTYAQHTSLFLKITDILYLSADKPPCPPSEMPEISNAPQLDAGLSFNMVPGGIQEPTAPPHPASVLSVPFQDQLAKPTQPQIPLHAKHSKKDKEKLELQPNRDQVYHIRGRSKNTWMLLLFLCMLLRFST